MRIKVYRKDYIADILLLKHKNTELYSFVNLTKGHICPCIFTSVKEAFDDLDNYKKQGKLISYEIIEN